MKTTVEMREIVGVIKRSEIVAGRYGNAWFTEHGFVMADPCYVLKDEDYMALLKARCESPEKDYKVWRSSWQPLRFEGETVYVRGTGVAILGYFGCSVDSGWVIIMPEKLYKKAQVAA